MNDAPSVLLPVDMQRAFDLPSWPPRWNEAVDRNGQALLGAWRSRGLPVIHVKHDSVSPGSTLAAGQPGNAFRPGFEPLGTEPVVSKSVNSAFIGTDLDLRLRRLGIRRVVVFGITTDMCVSTTIRVGANLGYDMVLNSWPSLPPPAQRRREKRSRLGAGGRVVWIPFPASRRPGPPRSVGPVRRAG
jgi:nicotinamidase-related amidase